MTNPRKGKAASNSFSAEEIYVQCDIWTALLQGRDVRQLLKSDPARNIMRKFLAMRETLVKTPPAKTEIQ